MKIIRPGSVTATVDQAPEPGCNSPDNADSVIRQVYWITVANMIYYFERRTACLNISSSNLVSKSRLQIF